MTPLTTAQQIAIAIIPLLFAITLHEVAHGWVANHFGDPTAKLMGRLTLNPISHIDPIGTILVPVILLYTTGFIFGWAKPVPVNFRNLRSPRRDMALVALAGPMSNFLMALCWALVARIALSFNPDQNTAVLFLFYMGNAGIFYLWRLARLHNFTSYPEGMAANFFVLVPALSIT